MQPFPHKRAYNVLVPYLPNPLVPAYERIVERDLPGASGITANGLVWESGEIITQKNYYSSKGRFIKAVFISRRPYMYYFPRNQEERIVNRHREV